MGPVTRWYEGFTIVLVHESPDEGGAYRVTVGRYCPTCHQKQRWDGLSGVSREAALNALMVRCQEDKPQQVPNDVLRAIAGMWSEAVPAGD